VPYVKGDPVHQEHILMTREKRLGYVLYAFRMRRVEHIEEGSTLSDGWRVYKLKLNELEVDKMV
jgi:hypothetical protein